MAEIQFNKNIQPELQAEIEKYFRPFIWLVPQWCQVIHMNLWADGDPAVTISVSVNYEYRNVAMHFQAGWLNQDPARKQEQVLHEVIHMHLGLIADYAAYTINNLCPKDDAHKFNAAMMRELTDRHEAATQDLAHAIFERFKAHFHN